MGKFRRLAYCLMVAGALVACQTTPYQAKPLNIEEISQKVNEKSPYQAGFIEYLTKSGYAKDNLPFKSWGINELTLSALYYHPQLEVAKAQLALANSQTELAASKSSPTIGGRLAHSNQKNGDIQPWAYGLEVEIPIETNNKRALKVEEANALADAARMDVADTAWQLRRQITQDFIRYHENNASIQQLQSALSLNTEIEAMLKKRVESGLATNSELNQFTIARLKAESSLSALTTQQNELLANLASDSGLSLAAFKTIPVQAFDLETSLRLQNNALAEHDIQHELQAQALLNRIDIRRALAKYAAAEANIKLEIAKETPDISLTPSFAFEFGDSIWSLGFSSLLNLVNKHPTQLAQAKAMRALEGAQFEQLQSEVISNLQQAYAQYEASISALNLADAQYQKELATYQKQSKQFDAGLTDRLSLKQAALMLSNAQQQVLVLKFAVMTAIANIENQLQRPLLTDATFKSLSKPYE